MQLRELMKRSGMFMGRHHWANDKLFNRTKEFIQQHLNFKNPTDRETWAIVLLLNPAKGITKSNRKSSYKKPACEELCRSVGKEGLLLYRDIFQNNNKKVIAQFF